MTAETENLRGQAGSKRARTAYAAATAAVFALGAWYRFHWPPEPFFDADGWGYLWTGLHKLTGGGFELIFGREYVYPGLIAVELFFGGSFRTITYLQHALGLVSGGLLLACCHVLTGLAHGRGAVRSPCWAGLALTAVYLGNFNTFYYEHSIRPEAVFPCFVLASVFLNLLICANLQRGRSPDSLLWIGGANLALTALLILLRPSFRLSGLCANLPFALLLLRGGYSLGRRVTVFAVALAAAALIWLPQPLLSAQSRWSVRLAAERLFSGNCDLISRQLDADVAAHRFGTFDPAWLRGVDRAVAAKLAESRLPENNPWEALGFNADYLIVTGNPLAPFFPDTLAGDRAMAGFCSHYFLRAAFHQPLALARKAWHQLCLFYATGAGVNQANWHHLHWKRLKKVGRANTDSNRVSPRFYYREAAEKLHPGPPYDAVVAASAEASAYQAACRRLARSHERYMNPWPFLVADKFCWLAQVLLALAAFGVCVAGRSPSRALTGAQWVVFSYAFASCVVTAVVFMVVDRYVQTLDAPVLVSTYASSLVVGGAFRRVNRTSGAARYTKTDPRDNPSAPD